MTEKKKQEVEWVPFEKWNKIQNETETTWKITEKTVRMKNPRRVTQFARNR